MGFLVVSKELVRRSLTEPRGAQAKKKPRPAEADRGKEKRGRTPSGLLHRVALSSLPSLSNPTKQIVD
jgi:hypothetical protein